jgi:hypothetical protein
MREQTELGNLYVGWNRYFARIILDNIEGRELALKLEDDYIKAYRIKTGKRPRGNRKERKFK